MKTQVAVAALIAVVPFLPLAAAPGRVFEGIQLGALKQTRQMRDMPEIYERDPATRRYRLREEAIQIPLGEAWLSFHPGHRASYLNKVPGEDAAIYFGPIEGDAFERFKLEERFISSLRKDSASDVLYRLDLMLRTGDDQLRERAIRIMTAGLAADVAAETRSYHLAKFRQLAAGLEAREAAPLRAAIEETERRIEELTVRLPDSDYSPGNDELARQGRLQDWMEPAVKVPEAAWGGAQNGLRAAAVFSHAQAALGQEITVWILVENVGDKEIRFGCSDVMQEARPKITRPDGKEVPSKSSWFTGLSPIRRFKLQPGERLTLAKKSLSFEATDSTASPGFGGNRVQAGPGEYRVRYESVINTGSAWRREADGLMHRTLPARGEWTGRLTTAESTVSVTDKRGAVVD